jgi:hypothetical protein
VQAADLLGQSVRTGTPRRVTTWPQGGRNAAALAKMGQAAMPARFWMRSRLNDPPAEPGLGTDRLRSGSTSDFQRRAATVEGPVPQPWAHPS